MITAYGTPSRRLVMAAFRPCRYGFVAVTIEARVRHTNGTSHTRKASSRSSVAVLCPSPLGTQKSMSSR